MQKREIISKDKVKEEIPKIVASKTGIPLGIVENVLSFAFNDAKKAFRLHKEIEISGFGTFKVVPGRIKHRIKNLEGQIASMEAELATDPGDIRVKNLNLKLHTVRADLEYLKSLL